MTQQASAVPPPQFPQEAYYYANMYQVGSPVTTYRVRFRSSIIFGILCLLLAGLIAGVILFADPTFDPAVWLASLIFIVPCLAGAAYFLVVYPLIYRSWRIYAGADGFIFLKGSKAVGCRWDQVAFVWQRIVRTYTNGIYTGTSFKFTIRRTDGVEIILDGTIHNGMQLGTQLQREATRHLTPLSLAAIEAGQTLPFGPLSASWQGLNTIRGVLPWNTIQEVNTKRGMLWIHQRGQNRARWYGGVDKIPNLYVFFNVVNTLSKGQ